MGNSAHMSDSLGLARKSAQALQWRSILIACVALGSSAHVAASVAASRGVEVIVATRELTHGTVIDRADISRARVLLPRQTSDVLVSDADSVIGHRVIGHIGAGEPITRSRYQQHPSPTQMTAMAVPISDADAALVTVGDRVDVYAGNSTIDAPAARRIATEVEVIKLTSGGNRFAQGAATAVVLVDARAASAIAAAREHNQLSIAVHGLGQ